MIRSSMPSPLTSPAPLTELPERSSAAAPWMIRSAVGSRGRWSPGSPDRCRTPRSWRRHSHGRSGRHRSADDQIVDAVAVDVARPAHRDAGWSSAAAPSMIRSASSAEVEGRRKALIACRTPRSSRRHSTAVRVGTVGPDDQIVDAVAVDVARPATEPPLVIRRGALDGQRRPSSVARSRVAGKP